MKSMFWEFVRSESGVTSIEYALIATFISVAIITGVTGVGNGLSNIFNNVKNSF